MLARPLKGPQADGRITAAMANIQSAKKNIRKNARQAAVNLHWKIAAKKVIKAVAKSPSAENISKAQKALAKAAQHGPIHPNKAARLTSRLMKRVATQSKKQSPKKSS